MNLETVEHITTASLDHFWKAVKKWNDEPQKINKNICFAWKLLFCKIIEPEYIENITLLSTIKDVLNHSDVRAVSAPWIIDKLARAGIKVITILEDFKFTEPGKYIYIKKLVPNDIHKPFLEIVIKDTVSNSVTFLGLVDTDNQQILSANFPYHLQYMQTKDHPKIWLVIESLGSTKHDQWLKECVFNTIIKWAEVAGRKASGCGANLRSSQHIVDNVNFNALYQHLKKKYGSEMMKIWPEVKYPETFLCEDVVIAAYLLLLWESYNQQYESEKQTFVDLKCGNGLLVHILNNEGHHGKGFDEIKRDIWSIYPETTKLEVQTKPLSDIRHPETDWLIGRQSKELTAWIPIIAAKSSYKCKFFIVPCCLCKLNGQAYKRITSPVYGFENYMYSLGYLLCNACGFVGITDRLNSPSSKQTFFIGGERIYPEEDQKEIGESDIEYIHSLIKGKSEIKGGGTTDVCQNCLDIFHSHPTVEMVRNSTDKILVDDIVAVIIKQVLMKKRLITVTGSGGQEKTWNAGGTCTLSELAKAIHNCKLKKLRKEYGGLLILLKSHCHIFHLNNRMVSLKIPEPNLTKPELKKEKPCWFHCNHPEGCPLADKDCIFKH